MPRSKALDSLLKEYPELSAMKTESVETKEVSQEAKPKRQYRRKALETIPEHVPSITTKSPVMKIQQNVDPSSADTLSQKKAKKPNKWLDHVQEVRKANADKNYRDCLILAKTNYVR